MRSNTFLIILAILQMRQSFSYFDKQDKRTKAEQKVENESDDKLHKAREKSNNFVSKIGADEPWCETLWHLHKSYEAELERKKIFEPRAVDGSYSLDLQSIRSHEY